MRIPVRSLPAAIGLLLAAAAIAGAPPAAADVAAVSEKAYEDTTVGYSILPIRGWESKPRKGPEDPMALADAGGWYSKSAEAKAECSVLKFGTFFPVETAPVATESTGGGGGEEPGGGGSGGGDGKGDPPGGGEKPKGEAPKPPPRTVKEMFGKGPQSFAEWIDLQEKGYKRMGVTLNLESTKAKFGDDEGMTWEGGLYRGSSKLNLYGASVKRGTLEVAVLYEAPDGKTFVRDYRGAFKASLKSLRILSEKTMRKAREALDRRLAGAGGEAAWAERAIASLPPGWTHFKTAHYVIVYDKSIDTTTPGLIKRITNQLEWLRAQIYEPMFPASRPVTALSIVKVTQDVQQYLSYGAPAGTGGYWSWPSRELVFFCKSDDYNLTLDVLNHEAFHQYIFYAVGQVSPHSWFNEGHGDFFAGYNLKEGKFIPGKFAWRQKVIQSGIENNSYVPLKEFLGFSQAEYYRRGGSKRKGEDVGQNYAQGWSLVWFLRTTKDPRYTGILERYFVSLKASVSKWREEEEGLAAKESRPVAELIPPEVNQKATDDALKAAFDGVDIDQLERDWVASKPY